MKKILAKLKNIFKKRKTFLEKALSKTQYLFSNIKEILKKGLSEEEIEKLEELLIEADIGPATVQEIIEKLKRNKVKEYKIAIDMIKMHLLEILNSAPVSSHILSPTTSPYVMMIIGVNGTGKTTTIGKLAYKYVNQNKKVIIAAADTFRAGGIQQVEIWAKRAKSEIIHQQPGADPAAVAHDTVEKAINKKYDVVLIDTAGRLHTKTNLINELKKIKRVISNLYPSAPQEIILVMDATTGQNGISQAQIFTNEIGATGIILTKIDGTAKGGIVIPIVRQLRLPILFLGTGEKIEDLIEFSPSQFVNALLNDE